MDKTATSHSRHDEMLIVRLFGGDVDDLERARALGVMAECDDCAALFADLGATAAATSSLPVPVRPRDFFLTEADAARLRPARGRFGFLSALRRTRAIGSALVAAGLVGVIATASLGIVGGPAGSTTFSAGRDSTNDAAIVAAGSEATAAPAAMGVAQVPESSTATKNVGPAATTAAAATDAAALANSSASPSGVSLAGIFPSPNASAPPMLAVAPTPAVSTPPVPADANPEASVAPGADDQQVVTTSGAGPQDVPPTRESGPSNGGTDSRLVWIGGFGLLFLIGLAVLVGPLIRRRIAR